MGFTKLEKDVLNISKLPDSVKGNAKDLKATFDKAGEDIKKAHNDLIDELEEQNAASNIGALSEEGATTVQAELDKLNDRIKVDFTELEIDLDDELSLESENAVKNKAITKEVNAVKTDLYSFDRYNRATVEIKEISNGLSTKNIFGDLIPFGFNDCRNVMVDIKGSSVYSESDTYKLINAFDASVSSYWESASETKPYLEFRFKEPIKINKIKARISNGSTSYFTQAKIVASNNEITWTPLYTLTAVQSAVEELVLENTDYFSVYRIEWEFSKSTYASLYHFELTEWEGSHKIYYHNLSFPLSEYKINKKIAIQLDEQILEEPDYVEEEFHENIIPLMSAATIENQYGKWQAKAGVSGNAWSPFDRDDSTGINFKTSNLIYSSIESILGSNNINFAIKPKKVRVYAKGASKMRIQGKREDGFWETITGEYSTSSNTVAKNITIDIDKYYSGLRVQARSYETDTTSYIYSFEITEGSIRYGKLGKKLRTFENPVLDINNLGAKQINGTISADQKYILLYNGESWDIHREYIVGTYTGDDQNERLIPLGFKPKAVYVEINAYTGDSYAKGLMLENVPIHNSKYAYITDNGFVVRYNSSSDIYLNSSTESWNPYRYIAFK